MFCVVVCGYFCCDFDYEFVGFRIECYLVLCVFIIKINDKESIGDVGRIWRCWVIFFNGIVGCCLFVFF